MTSAYLSPYDAPGQASAMKRAATGGDARFGKDDEGDRKPKAMPPCAPEGGNPMNPSAYGTGARGELSPMSNATQLFTGCLGEAGRGEVNAEDRKAPPLQPSLKSVPESPVTLFHYESSEMDICGGRVGKGARFCVKTRAVCGYRHKLN